MKNYIAILAVALLTIAMAISLSGCADHASSYQGGTSSSRATAGSDAALQSSPSINDGAPTAQTLVAAVGGYGGPVPSPTSQRAVAKAYAAVNYSDTLPVNSLDTCMAAVTMTDNTVALADHSYWSFAASGERPETTYPETAFSAMLDAKAYSKAKTSGNTFDMMDVNKSIQSKIQSFAQNIYKRNLHYVSYDDPSGANTILQYAHQYPGEQTSRMGFIVNDEYALVHTAPIYRKSGIDTRCVLFIAGQENYSFVPVTNENVARQINDLVVAHKVHPRYILQPLFWQYGGDKTSVEVNGILAKLQLVGPDGAVLAEASFDAGVPPQN